MFISRFFLLFSSLFFISCSSLLYHPTNVLYFDPEHFELTPKEVILETKDHHKLWGWHFEVTKPKALIVFFHGNAENLTSHFVSLKWILKHQVEYMIFDYRGYGKSLGDPTPEGTVIDGMAALKWGQEEAKRKKIPLLLYGQSLGGAVLMRSFVEMKQELSASALIVDSTFSSYQKAGQSVLSRAILTWPFQWLSYLVLSDEWAPFEVIDEISPTPLLVIHGTKDRVVDLDLGRDVYEQAKDPKEWITVDGAGHIQSFFVNEGSFQKVFLEKIKQLASF